MADARDGDADDVRWLSYAELAEARGISKASATRLAFRRRWRRQVGNDGTARAAVPVSELQEKQPGTHDSAHDDRDGATHVVRALEGTITLLREQLDRERRLADEARTDLRAEREAGLQREDAGAEERRRLGERVTALEAELAAVRAQASRAGWARLRSLLRRTAGR